MSKKRLLERARHAFIEQEIAHQFYEDVQGITVFDWRDFVRPYGFNVDPFIKSRLQYIQIGAALSAKEYLVGRVTATDIAVINSFKPKEDRLRKIQCRRHQIFFDGDMTSPVRLNALGDTMYSPQILVVHAAADDEYYDLDMKLQDDCLHSVLQKFDTVYVSQSVDERFRAFAVRQCCSDTDTSVVLYDGRVPNLPDATLFVHWGAYWRTHNDESLVVDIF
jgi:hypothetical protein